MIYFVEDDNSIREFVLYTLSSQGMEAQGFSEAESFWAAVGRRTPDLVLLDIMLPGEDGLHILRRLRQNPATSKVPVMMLTAKGTEYDKVVGLDAGADDYLPKPFGIMELLARIRALLRRTGGEGTDVEYQLGPLYVCPAKHIVRVGDETVPLTLKEFELLCLFLKNPGVVFNRDQLLDQVWGYTFDGESRTVDVHIRTLRKKLGVSGSLIETVRGVGYKLKEQEDR